MTSTSKRYCSVPQCGNYVSTEISLHYFPKDTELQNKWKTALKICKNITPYMNVCSAHFLPSDYHHTKTPNKRGILKHGVIPTQNLSPMQFARRNVKKHTKNVVDTLKHKEAYMEDGRETMENSANYQNVEEIYIKEEPLEETMENSANYQNVEEIYIKEEPLEETSIDREFYENIRQSVKKEECVTDNDNQIDSPITIKNDETSNRFYCPECNKSFKQYSILKMHMKKHKELMEFECPTCFKSFMKTCHLKYHMKLHNEIKDYKCTI